MKALKYSRTIAGLLLFAIAIIAFTGVFDIGFLDAGFGVSLAFALPIADLEEPSAGSCGVSGVSTIAYVVPLEDIDTLATLKSIRSEIEDYAVLQGSHTLKAGRFFMEMTTEEELSSMVANSEGQKSSRFFRFEGQLMYPRNSRRAIGLANMLKGVKVVAIIKDLKTQEMFSIGTKDLPLRLVPSATTGQAYGDESGVTFTLEAAACSINIYEGAIVTETEIINNPITLAPDATTIDASLGSSFVIGANTAAQDITSIVNLDVGITLRVAYNSSSAQNATISALANSQSVTLTSDGDFVEIKNTGLGLTAQDGVTT